MITEAGSLPIKNPNVGTFSLGNINMNIVCFKLKICQTAQFISVKIQEIELHAL